MPNPTIYEPHLSHAQGRIGIIDIGSNSMRLVIFDQLKRSPIPVYNEKVLCQLGKGLALSGKLNPEGVTMAMQVMPRFLEMAAHMEVLELNVFATAAVRQAEDGACFVQQLVSTLGIDVEVISGTREARLGAEGLMASMYNPVGITGDLGGGSMELVAIDQHHIHQQSTLPIGTLKLLDHTGGNPDKVEAVVRHALSSIHWLSAPFPNFYAIGGSFRALAKIHMMENAYPLNIIHEYRVPAKKFRKFTHEIARMPAEKLAKRPGVSNKRLTMIPVAAEILSCVLEVVKPETIVFSASGIREGFVHNKLSPRIRSQDGLIAACADFASSNGHSLAYAQELYAWTTPLFTGESEEGARLRMAACMLTELGLYAHPEYRADLVFQRILYSTLPCLTHSARTQLALVCYHRYRTRFKKEEPALSLMNKTERNWAEKLGLAANLAHCLSGGYPGCLPNIPLTLENNSITLTYDDTLTMLQGDAITRRLDVLQQAIS